MEKPDSKKEKLKFKKTIKTELCFYSLLLWQWIVSYLYTNAMALPSFIQKLPPPPSMS